MRAGWSGAAAAWRSRHETAAVCQWRSWCTSATAAALGQTRHLAAGDGAGDGGG
jgi:hypothetical protein